MSDQKIESIRERDGAQRTKLWDHYQNHLDQMEEDLKNDKLDPFESAAAQKVMALSHHINGATLRETNNALSDLILDHRVKRLKDAYQPKWYEYALLALQAGGAIGAGVIGCGPAIGGFNAGTCQAISGAVQGLLVGGSQSGQSIAHSAHQGEQALASYELEADKRRQGDHDHQRQIAIQEMQRRADETKEMQRKKSEAWREIASG